MIVTEKDAIKLDPDAKGGPKVWVAPLDCRLPAETVREVMALLPSPPAALQPGNDDA